MNKTIVALLAAVVFGLGSASSLRAETMTFDSLASDFMPVSTYTENGFRLFALDGPPEHFHPTNNPNNNTTGAQFYSVDGVPQRFMRVGGGPFNFLGLDVFSIAANAVFTTSSSQSQIVSNAGSIVFGPAFQGITYVDITMTSGSIGIDNIASSIPEPATLVLIGLGLAAVCMQRKRRRL